MLASLNSATMSKVNNAYQDVRESSKKEPLTVAKQGDTSKIEKIKEAIGSGEYEINLQALSEKIAQELI